MTTPTHKTGPHAANWPPRVRSFRRWAPHAAMRGTRSRKRLTTHEPYEATGMSTFIGKHSDEDDDKKDTISTNGEEKGRPIPDDIPGKHEKKDDEDDDQR
jgi:hypothetical protein